MPSALLPVAVGPTMATSARARHHEPHADEHVDDEEREDEPEAALLRALSAVSGIGPCRCLGRQLMSAGDSL